MCPPARNGDPSLVDILSSRFLDKETDRIPVTASVTGLLQRLNSVSFVVSKRVQEIDAFNN